MDRVKKFVDEAVEANTGKVMAGDQVVTANVASSIAMQAASMARQMSGATQMAIKRYELACHVTGHILSNPNLVNLDRDDACFMGLKTVDQIMRLLADEEKIREKGADC